ncbi:MAG: hypothetical protein L0958_02810 [Candidatus Mariimomonas ferrooxydans]
MRILLIGNFSPPYEDEGLHNLSLLKKLGEEGNDCRVINISKKLIKADGITNAENYFDFLFKLVKYGWKKDVIHYLTKSYTRLSLLKFMTSVLIGRIFLAKPLLPFILRCSLSSASQGATQAEHSQCMQFFLWYIRLFAETGTPVIVRYNITKNPTNLR